MSSSLVLKGKNPHALDSWVFYYQNAGGNRDNIKIEINYSMRCHVLPIHQTEVKIDVLDTGIKINALAPVELFGSKIKALLERTAARDLYDIYNMIPEVKAFLHELLMLTERKTTFLHAFANGV